MSRLRALLHVASPSKRNTQQPSELQVQPGRREVFSFLPLADPDPDGVDLSQQRYGRDGTTACQEARWQGERELAWRTFIKNASRILAAPIAQQRALLAIYRSEAARRYGERAGTDMARSMESWVRAKGVH